ncbi:MAG: hypothetical protein HQL01_09145 [Nitrospirae bacterium]|nr:hypothetical protein [Nitrospirota bacterium]
MENADIVTNFTVDKSPCLKRLETTEIRLNKDLLKCISNIESLPFPDRWRSEGISPPTNECKEKSIIDVEGDFGVDAGFILIISGFINDMD